MDIGLIILVFFLLIHFLAGFSFRNIRKTPEDFVLAGKSVGTLSATMSLLATILGASAIIGTSGLASKHGQTAIIWLGSGAIGLIILRFLIDKVDFKNALSLPQMLAKNGDNSLRLAAAFVIVPTWIGIIAAQLAAAGRIASAISPNSFELVTVVSAIAVCSYVLISGQRGVIRTDKIQFAFTLLLISFLLFIVFSNNSSISYPDFKPLSNIKMIDISIAVAFPFLIGPDIFSRLLTVKDNQTRKKVLLFSAVTLALISVLIVYIGMSASGLLSGLSGEQLFIKLPTQYFGTFAGYLAAIGLMSIVISSADTCLFTAATIVSVDVLGKESKKAINIATIIIAILAVLLALWLGGVLKALFWSYTIYTSGLAVPIVFVLFTKRKFSTLSIWVSILSGASVGVLGKLLEWSFVMPMALAISLLSILIIDWFMKKRQKKDTKIQ